MTTASPPAALSHVRVLDLSRILAGPWASQMLADLGADVIKIERPEVGDDTRGWGPPFLKGVEGEALGDSAYFLCCNRNKRSVAIDFTVPAGQALIRQLVLKSDVLIENFKPGGLARYGLDYGSLAALHPGLVYCSITGFGQTGPYATQAGYDFLMQGMGGLMSITGLPDGEPGGGPMKVGVAVTDVLTGMHATVAILAALSHRDQAGDGRGQHIDLALLDVQVACLANQNMNYLHGAKVPQRLGNAHPNVVPYQDFPTADGDMILAVGNDGQFARLCAVLDRPEWARDSRFATNAARVENRRVLIPMLRGETKKRPTRDWMAALQAAAVPCGPINTIADVFADPQVAARGMRISMERADAGEIALVANPLRMSATPVQYRRPPPRLGEHTQDVLEGLLEMDGVKLESLVAGGAVGLAADPGAGR